MMGRVSGVIRRWGVVASLLLVAFIPVHADVTTELSSSILIFPKVMFDSLGLQTNGLPVDTIIQISNKSNQLVFARCIYVNAVPDDPSRPPSASNPAQWQEIDFDITLTKQQPTHWQISTGRSTQPDPTCNRTVHNCFNAGFDPGFVPPVSDPFTGELKCIEVDSTGAPLSGNHLKGEATLVTPTDRDASKYNAIGVLGINTDAGPNDGDNTLCLGGTVTPDCMAGAEYNACPATVIMDHFAERATDPVIEELHNGPSQVTTELTIVPCTENFELQTPSSVTVQFLMTNEFEQPFSTSTTVTCWGNLRLSSIGNVGRIFDVSILGTRFVQTRMSSPVTDASGNPESGFVAVAEEFHHGAPGGPTFNGRAAFNLHIEGERLNGDLITLPEH